MFEKGLPGYDSWLDNHGNPGMGDENEDTAYIWEWAIIETVDITQIAENTYRVQRIAGPEWFDLSFDTSAEPGKTILFNGKFLDVGEALPEWLGLADEYHELGGELNKTVRLTQGDDWS